MILIDTILITHSTALMVRLIIRFVSMHVYINALGVQGVISQRVQKSYFNLPEEAKPLGRISIKSNHCFYTARI